MSERYGDVSGFRLLRIAEDLPQTDQTLDWLVGELKAENRLDDYRLGHSLLYQFAYEAVEPVTFMVQQAQQLDAETLDLRYHLMAEATLMNVQFPPYEQWYHFCEKTDWDWKGEVHPASMEGVWWWRRNPSEWN